MLLFRTIRGKTASDGIHPHLSSCCYPQSVRWARYRFSTHTARRYSVFKRVAEKILSIVLLIPLARVLLFLAFAIRRDSPGRPCTGNPASERTANLVTCYKLRTMYVAKVARRLDCVLLRAYVFNAKRAAMVRPRKNRHLTVGWFLPVSSQ